MHSRMALSFRTLSTLAVVGLAAAAILLGNSTPGRADAKTKHVLMLHSFGLRFKPWTVYAEAIRAEISRRRSVDFQDHSLVTARLSDDKSDRPFVEYLHALNAEQPPDLIMSIGAPAANFVQRHRKDLFPNTPMVLTAVERRRVDFDKLGENDTVVAPTPLLNFLKISACLALTTTIAVVIARLQAKRIGWKRHAGEPPLAELQIRYYNELSFEEI